MKYSPVCFHSLQRSNTIKVKIIPCYLKIIPCYLKNHTLLSKNQSQMCVWMMLSLIFWGSLTHCCCGNPPLDFVITKLKAFQEREKTDQSLVYKYFLLRLIESDAQLQSHTENNLILLMYIKKVCIIYCHTQPSVLPWHSPRVDITTVIVIPRVSRIQ